jgi:hypothetical protein
MEYLKDEHLCGRALGILFHKRTGYLYIADAYYGLFKVGPEGGLATPNFTTDLDSTPTATSTSPIASSTTDADRLFFPTGRLPPHPAASSAHPPPARTAAPRASSLPARG